MRAFPPFARFGPFGPGALEAPEGVALALGVLDLFRGGFSTSVLAFLPSLSVDAPEPLVGDIFFKRDRLLLFFAILPLPFAFLS